MYPIVAETMVKCLWPGGDSLLLICVYCKLLANRVLFGRVQRNGNLRTSYDQLGFQGLCNIQSCAFTQDGLLWGGWHWWCIAADAAIDTVLCASVKGTLCLSHHLLSSHCFSPFPILPVSSLQLSEQWLVSDHPFTTHPTMPLFRVTSAHLSPFQNSLIGLHPSSQPLTIPIYLFILPVFGILIGPCDHWRWKAQYFLKLLVMGHPVPYIFQKTWILIHW